MSQRLSELRSEDLKNIRGSISRASLCQSFEEFGEQSLHDMSILVGADNVCFNQFSADLTHLVNYYLPRDYAIAAEPHNDALNAHMHLHPVLSQIGWDGISGNTAKMSDFVEDRVFQEHPLYREAYQYIDARYQLSNYLGQYGGFGVALTLNRKERDFSDREQQAIQLYAQEMSVVLSDFSRVLHLRSSLGFLQSYLSEHLSKDMDTLTTAELNVMSDLAAGKRISEIAEKRRVKENTIHKQSQRICEKTGVSGIRKLVAILRGG